MLIARQWPRCLVYIKGQNEKGFTLIEALIALVVFSIGLLGLAAMYSKSMMVTHSAYMRSLASIQALDMAERIRANIYLNHAASPYTLSVNDSTSSIQDVADRCNATSRCAATELRDWDIDSWIDETQNLFGALFQGAEIVFDSALNEYEIELTWSERDPEPGQNSSGLDTISFSYRVSL